MLPLKASLRFDVEGSLPWERDILHQGFFAEPFAELADEDRSALLCTNRHTRAVFLKHAQNTLFALSDVINLTYRMAESALSAPQKFQVTNLSPVDSLPKINDQFFAMVELLSKQLGVLKPIQKIEVKEHLLISSEISIRKLPRLLHLFANCNDLPTIQLLFSDLRAFIEEMGYQNELAELEVREKDIFFKLSEPNYDRSLLFFEITDVLTYFARSLSVSHPAFLEHLDKFATFHSPSHHSKEKLIEMGYIGEAVKNQFPKSLHPLNCISLISSIAAAGNFNWAMKLVEIMVANLHEKYTEDAEKLSWRENAYYAIAQNASFICKYFLIDLFQTPLYQYQLITQILDQAMAPKRDYETSKVLYLLQSKKCFTAALQVIEVAQDLNLSPLIDLACQEGEPDAALDLLNRLGRSRHRLFLNTFRQISQAFADKGHFEQAHKILSKGLR